ncbi:isocitrate/isopropylmalate dehydrogenase family protein [Ruminococcaceae bacterium OttesenSCG-928-O06]|nr:isocitrate/isopropylmalate dehydrogenase family protein [Ruminococcaceae bacterium OttesenSCG-928-O06]
MQRLDEILQKQKQRVAAMRTQGDFIDYNTLSPLIIGVCGGDGIGPVITKVSEDVLRFLLQEDIAAGKVQLRTIDGLTIENRIAEGAAIPKDVLAALKECHVILKGPTTTPDASYTGPNIESANVAMRRELDLFANMRPVKVPEEGIDWTFFRENTEGSYAVGSLGFEAEDGISVDFTITTTEGTRRIARLAFEYAKTNGKTRVAVVTKANVIKETDGKFLRIANEIAQEYPGITAESWYADIMTAKLVDEKRRREFEVMLLPNLYGDIITDEAAEFQGGVGTAGSANIGKRYAMFEAIHGSAPRMVAEGRDMYADPCSMLRASVMLLRHIGRADAAGRLEAALDKCMFTEKKLAVTGRPTGATSAAFGQYVLDTIAAG